MTRVDELLSQLSDVSNKVYNQRMMELEEELQKIGPGCEKCNSAFFRHTLVTEVPGYKSYIKCPDNVG